LTPVAATGRASVETALQRSSARAAGRAQIEIARIWGIGITVHASWFIVFALVTWSVAADFPVEFPGWAPWTYWLTGALTALLFFSSVVVHELGHSWVALRQGIPISRIALFVFGGMAQMQREPASPAAEFRIALAGPLASLGLSVVFAVAAIAGHEVAPVTASALWLAHMNLLLALFNLVPGFPLDGGRMLRAGVWHWTKSFDRATEVASIAGRLISAAVMTGGVVLALGGEVAGGVWLLLIGWFLENAAAATQAEAGLRAALRDVTVAQAMTRECSRVARDLTLGQLVRDEVLGAGRRCFFVIDGGRLAGLVTLSEVKRVPPERREAIKVDEVMVPATRLAVVQPGDRVLAALQRMADGRVAQLPVVVDGALLGMIGREEILHYVRNRAELGL